MKPNTAENPFPASALRSGTSDVIAQDLGMARSVFGDRPQSLTRTIVRLASPAVAENLLQTLLLMIDTFMVAYYGSVPIAAAAAAGMLLWRLHMTLGCIERGTTAMVARRWGEGSREGAAQASGQSLLLAIVIGGLLTLGGILWTPQLLRAIHTPEETIPTAVPYMRVVLAASIPRLVFFVGAASIRAIGNTSVPMYIALAMNISNIFFNYLLIYGKWGFPELKLFGSGISTAIALVLAALVITCYLVRASHGPVLRLRHLRPCSKTIRTICRISLPSLLEEVVISIGFLVFFSFVTRLGTIPLAAHALATRLESLSFMAGVGFSTAAATLVGQALGCGSVSLARQSFRQTTKLAVGVMSAVAMTLVVIGRQLLQLFCNEAEVVELAYLILLITAVEQPLLAIAMTLSGGLRGAGETVSPMLASLLGNLVVRISASYLLAFPLGLGIYGIVLGTIVDWLVRCAILYIGYAADRWSKVEL
ncbi:MAG: MATE family efflux transporter [Candidatus Sumerlaeaceae bacterium]|nr:MATE family efflux transporter [Candidatus Sumerlaeaceae bacterium]